MLLAIVAGVAATIYAGLGLGGGGSTEGTPFTPVAEAAERTAQLPGARFSGTGSATSQGTRIEMTFTGAFSGDRSSMRMESHMPGAPPQVAELMNPMLAVQDGLVMYFSAPVFAAEIGKPWMKLDLGELADIDMEALQANNTADARSMLDALRAVSVNPQVVGEERIRGIQTTHYLATIDPQLLAEQAAASGSELQAEIIEQQGGGGSIEVWVGKQDGLVHRISQVVPFELVGGAGSQMTMTFDLYDFGVTPEIEIPPDDEVFDGTDFAQQGVEQILEDS